jgi:hypothetical protein
MIPLTTDAIHLPGRCRRRRTSRILQAVLFVVDRHRARQATGITFMGQVP